MATEVFLMQDVDKLGKEGEIVRVADGYARNYLIPHHIAEPVTEAARRRLAKIQAAREAERKATLSDAKRRAGLLKEASVTIRAKVAEEQNLYGSVSAADIAEAVSEAYPTAKIDKSIVDIEAPFKTTGAFDVPVKIHPEVTATVKVWVVAE
jgi:large subunit ribosomal protein L9